MIRRFIVYEFCFQGIVIFLPPLAFLFATTALRALGYICPLNHDYVFLCVTLSLVWTVCAIHFHVTSVEALFADSDSLRNCLKALAWTYMSCFSALFFYRGATYSRLVVGPSAVILLAEILLLRVVLRKVLRHASWQQERLRIVVIGADRFAAETSERLKSSAIAPCDTVAFVRLPGQEVLVGDRVPVLELEQLMRQNLKHFAHDMVLAASPEMLPILSSMIERLRGLAIPIRFCLDFGTDVKVQERFFRVGGTHMLDVHIAPSETVSYLILKRCFDIAFSVLALVLSGIPMLVIALAVKLSSPGPVLFAQQRVGINGQLFNMLKFRTMTVSSPADSDTRWTAPGDPRCTVLGRLLRKSSLDELPQFFNVFRGEMSVVGPRPERPHFVEKFKEEIDAYNARHHLKSGITGWAQVNGLRGDTDISKRVELDLYYIKNWSLVFDIQIILMTVFSGFFARNAY